MKNLILGSQSPRRKEILSFFDIDFEQVCSRYDEDAVPFNGEPIKYVTTLSEGKSLELHQRFPEAPILTADTIVCRDDKVFGKPANIEEAISTLEKLQGQWHSVFTALCLRQGHQLFSAVEETRVLFNPLTPKEIVLYVNQLEWADKAGGYAIQGAGGLIVRKIDGCYYNVMGLPINALRSILVNIGFDLWEHIKKK